MEQSSNPTGTVAQATPEQLQQQRQAEQKALKQQIEQEDQIRKDKLEDDTAELFSNLAMYLKGELQSTSDDYKLLETMNQVTKEKYEDMTTMAAILVKHMEELQQKYAKYQPYLEKIDEIDSSLTELEKTVLLLDEYTLKLENKFKYLKEAKRLPYKKPALQPL